MKKIETERLILRPWNMDDAEDMYEYAKDPRVGPAAGWPPHKDIEATRAYLTLTIAENDTFALQLKDTGKVIGAVGLHKRSRAALCYEVGYVLNPAYWGHGYMSEAVKRVIEYAFTETETELLTVKHRKSNLRSRRVVEKCGFRYEGVETLSAKNPDGAAEDIFSYCIKRDDYQKRGCAVLAPAYAFCQNPRCEYFPCHKTDRVEDFSCQFCYCPLYLIPDCGGNFTMLNGKIKDCSTCLIPHFHYDYINKKLGEYCTK